MEWATVTIRVPAKPFLTSAEVAVLADVKPNTLRKWVRDGRFPPPRRPGLWSGYSVGIWLAWQDLSAGVTEDAEDEKDDDDEPPVKGKNKISDVR